MGRFDHGDVIGAVTDRERDGLFIFFDQVDDHGLLEGSHPAANHRFAYKKQTNKHLFTAVSKVTKKKQQKIFTLSSDIEEKLLQLWLQSVDQRMAIYDQGVARIAVLVDDAQSWPDGHFLHFTADTGRVSPVAVIGTLNILQIVTEN